MIKFIHCGDIHLDATFTGLGRVSKKLQEKLLKANYDAFKGIVDQAIEHEVDFVLVSGDLFDNPQRSLESELRCKKQFTRLGDVGIKIFIVGGNHDPLKESFKVQWPSNTFFFSKHKGETQTLTIKDQKVYIHGISYDNEKVERNLVKLLPDAILEGINIGILHCDFGGMDNHYSPCTLSDLKSKAYDYFALGHIHQGSIISTNPYVVYSGCHQGKNIKEDGEKGCYIVTVDDSHIDVKFLRVNIVQWYQWDIDVTGFTLNDLYLKLQKVLGELEQNLPCSGAIVRFHLKGKGSLRDVSDSEIEALIHELNDDSFNTTNFIWVESIQKDITPEYDIDTLGEQNDFISTLLKVEKAMAQEGNKKEVFDSLELLNNFKIRKMIGDLDKNAILENARERLIQLLLGGEKSED